MIRPMRFGFDGLSIPCLNCCLFAPEVPEKAVVNRLGRCVRALRNVMRRALALTTKGQRVALPVA